MKKGIELPWEISDEITRITLEDSRRTLKKSLKDDKKNLAKAHPDDIADAMKIIGALDILIEYYGG